MSSSGPLLDPLYRRRTELPGTGEPAEFGGVAAEYTVVDTPPDVIDAQWMDDREVTLTVTDDVPAPQLASALAAFVDHAVTLADRPTSAVCALPSRDIVRAKVARDAGFSPSSVLAVADLRRPAESQATTVPVRDATPDDAATLAELWCEQAEYEAAVGTLRISDLIRAALRDKAAACIAGSSTVLVTEADGVVAGAVVADDPAESEWAAGRLALAPTSYVPLASTSATARSRGLGAALVAELHRRQRSAGIAASTLHYSAFNPLSVPFWSQRGYRPVVTIYARTLRR